MKSIYVGISSKKKSLQRKGVQTFAQTICQRNGISLNYIVVNGRIKTIVKFL